MSNEKVHRHFILFKPHGYNSQFVYNQSGRKPKLLGELFNFPEKTMAIGRLDKPSEGLLLLTTDGHMSEKVRSKSVEKEYYAQVDGVITPEALFNLTHGVKITVEGEQYNTLPCKVKKLETAPNLPDGLRIRGDHHGPTSWISITISEGKFRQVRRMTSAVGFPTLRLVRVRVGNIHIESMQPGEVKEVATFF